MYGASLRPWPTRFSLGRTALPVRQGPLKWILGEVVDLATETPRVKSIVLDVPGWPGHRPGQHVDVRLTAEDGYQAQRSYSIASAPEDGRVTLTVERIEDGEVSPFLVDELRERDRFELRGPIGGYFVWEAGTGGPLLLVGGGSGVVPLMAMTRHRAAAEEGTPARLLYSARTLEDVIYREELAELAARGDGFEVVHTLTRARPAGWTGYDRRVDAEMLAEVGFHDPGAIAYVCGPTGFVETVASALVDLGHEPGRIRTERFGPTGG
jgi:ferredoxin-NADP reductase